MYAIIYWVGEDKIYPLLTEGSNQLMLFDTLKEADAEAGTLENSKSGVEARVISIEGVKN